MNASNTPRKRLAPPWMVVSLGLGMIVCLAALFPKASLFGQLGRAGGDAKADSLRVLLLRNLLLKGERGMEMRKDYIRQLGLIGDYIGAFGELDRLMLRTAGTARDSVRMLEAEVSQWALAADSSDSAVRSRLKSGLRRLGDSATDTATLAWAARKADDAAEYQTALRIYVKLARAAADARAAHWYREGARLAASLGKCRDASDLHFLAQGRSQGVEDRKKAFLDGLRSLEACQQMDWAMDQAEQHLGPLRSDPQVLMFLVNLARSANRPKDAQKYALMLVKPGPAAGIR